MVAGNLTYWERNPPYAMVAAARISGIDVTLDALVTAPKGMVASLCLPSGEKLEGATMILRYLARLGPDSSGLTGSDALSSCYVDMWIEWSVTNLVNSSAFEAACGAVDSYLARRTFIVGHSLTLADLAVWGQLLAAGQWTKVKKSGKYPHLVRWMEHCSHLPVPAGTLLELDPRTAKKADAAATQKGGADTGSFDVGLPGAAEGKVVVRFPPEPSGYLHIGHAKAALLNNHFKQIYKGKLIVRFDDTNPTKENIEFVENILEDVSTLGVQYDRITYTSDYFPEMLQLAERLIGAGLIYADDTPVDQMREERMKSVPSKRRDRTAEENLRVFQEMMAGSEEGLANCMRFKIDMASLNTAMRDPVAYRCNLTPHWRTGTNYKVYPTYDCACPFVDAHEGVTHALRTSEYKDREAQYYWVLKAQQQVWPGLPDVHMWDYSRLNFVNTVLSKRKLLWFVTTGRVDGWDDPRMPTVKGVLRRGMQVAALKEFILSQGASKNVTYQEWDKIWTINKKHIDPVCPRHTAIVQQHAVPLHLSNGPPGREVVTVPRHKKHAPAGMKASVRTAVIWLEQADAAAIGEGEEVTLMDWGNCIVHAIGKDPAGRVTELQGTLNLAGSVKTTKLKLTWLAQIPDLVTLQLCDFDHLITKKKVEEDDVFEELVNDVTRTETVAWGDSNMRTLQRGDILQLERKGYFRVDRPLLKEGQPLVLFQMPDGRTKK